MAGAEFSDAAVSRSLLRQRAYNLRWAQQPDDVIPLTAADIDFPVSPAVRERLHRFVADGLFSYGPPEGLPEFRAAVAQWYTERRGVAYGPAAVLATDSAAAAMAIVARASLSAGDEVLIPDPVDFLFEHAVRRAGAIPVRVPLAPKTSATDYVAALAARRTDRTRMVWLCNPHNPWGTVPTARWLRAVARWAITHGLRLLSDEVWADITYPPRRCASVAALAPEIAAQTVTVYGFSKNFGLAGLRVGAVLCADARWREEIAHAADVHSTVAGVSVLSQVAAVAAMQEGEPWLADFLTHLRGQRDLVLERLRRWPGVSAHPPQGTFVAFPDLSGLDPDAEHLCQHFEHKAKVALVPGSPRWFGPGAAGHVRLSFATSREIITEAFDRLDPVVFELSHRR